MVREAAQEAINAIFDTEKPVIATPQLSVGNYTQASSAPQSVNSNSVRFEGFGSSNSGGNFQSGLKGISGPSTFEEDRSILSYASGTTTVSYSNGPSNKITGFGNMTSNSAHGFDGSKGIEVVKQVGAKAASILNAGPATLNCAS